MFILLLIDLLLCYWNDLEYQCSSRSINVLANNSLANPNMNLDMQSHRLKKNYSVGIVFFLPETALIVSISYQLDASVYYFCTSMFCCCSFLLLIGSKLPLLFDF